MARSLSIEDGKIKAVGETAENADLAIEPSVAVWMRID
jgi:hypothetical protein